MEKWLENVRMALNALLANKFRAVLTTFGIGIGIAAVVVLVSLGQALQGYLGRQFLSVGADLIYVRPVAAGNGFGGAAGRGGGLLSSLTDKDVSLLSDSYNLPDVKAVIPLIQLSRTADSGPYEEQVRIYGTTPGYFDTLNRPIESGRLFDDQDVLDNSRVAVIGQSTALTLFPDGSNPVGETIRIGGIQFRIIGTLQAVGGSAGFGGDQDDIIIAPITAVETHLDSERTPSGLIPINQVYVQAANIDAINDIMQNITALLSRQHKIKSARDLDFRVSSQQDVLNNFQSTISTLTIFLGVIGGISLVVGGIGVMNIMIVTVTERTREIGLRKAVGARGGDVLLQFLTEAVILCFVGGLGGILLAFGVSQVIRTLVANLQPVVSIQSILLAFVVTTLVGVFFGMYPASRAASLNPIQALRAE